jgi:biopolymer transport protein ExbD
MAMSASGFGAEDSPMSDINTTPLVDVMLVLLIIFLIAVPVAIQTIEKLRIPIFASVESKDKVENLLLTVVTTDAAGRSASEPGYEGSSRFGQCRVYFNNVTRVDAEELRDQAFKRLDSIVKREGGPEATAQQSREDPAGAYPRRHQHPVALHCRCDLQRADLGLSDRRLHFEPGRSERLIAASLANSKENPSWQCQAARTMAAR